MLEKYITWFKAHERLLVIALVLGVGLHGFNNWLDKRVMDANSKAAVTQEVSAEQKAVVEKLTAQINQQSALFQAAHEADQKEIDTLVAAVASRDAASNKKVNQVSGTKTPPQAVADLSSAYPLVKPIVPTDTGAQVPTEDLQQFTVAKIEGDTAKADLADTKSELQASQDSLTKAIALISGKDQQIDALNSLVTKNTNACEAEKKDLKAQAAKSRWHWFWAGVAAGFTGRSILK